MTDRIAIGNNNCIGNVMTIAVYFILFFLFSFNITLSHIQLRENLEITNADF